MPHNLPTCNSNPCALAIFVYLLEVAKREAILCYSVGYFSIAIVFFEEVWPLVVNGSVVRLACAPWGRADVEVETH